jgi:hypothetical protein
LAARSTQGWIDPRNQLISIMLIQRADGGTDSMTRNLSEHGRSRHRQIKRPRGKRAGSPVFPACPAAK